MKSVLCACLALACLTGPTFATSIVVDWAGSGDYVTIQEGIDAATYGDVVNVLSGYYNERIEMKDGVALKGDGPDCTMIDGTGWNYSTVVCDGSFSTDTVIEGFRISGGDGPGWSASGVWLGLECSAVVRYNVSIGNNIGMLVNYNNGEPTIDHNTIYGNYDCGIQVYVGNYTVVTGVAHISNNIIGENTHFGIMRNWDWTTSAPPMPDSDFNDVYSSGISDFLEVDAGPNDFSLDPMFCMVPTDMRIDAGSPCAGTGTGGSDRGALPAGCEPVAVEDRSWGAIKSMFR